MIDALIADASIGEVWGTVRVANGLPYDPFRAIESPFTYPAA
jgi:methylmalonyl-CoA mutase N-terminal domain/subunit